MGPACFSFLKFCLSFNWLFFSLSKLKYHIFYLFIYLFMQSVPVVCGTHNKAGLQFKCVLTDNPPSPGEVDYTTGVYVPQEPDKWKCCETGPTDFCPYPGIVEYETNRLQMSLQRQHFLLSYLKTLRVVSAWVWTRDRDLLRSRPALSQRS